MRFRSAPGGRYYRFAAFGDDGDDSGDDSSLTLSSPTLGIEGSGPTGGDATTTQEAGDLGIGPLQSDESDLATGQDTSQLTWGSEGTTLYGSDTGTGGSSSSGSSGSGFNWSSLLGGSSSAPLAKTSPAVAQAAPFLASIPTNYLILGGFGLLALLLVGRR